VFVTILANGMDLLRLGSNYQMIISRCRADRRRRSRSISRHMTQNWKESRRHGGT